MRDQAWVGVGSVATFLAFVVAFGAIIIDRRRRRDDERRNQARHVCAWPSGGRDATDGRMFARAILLNASDEPVFRVVAWLVAFQGAAWATGEQAMAQGAEEYAAAVSILPPGQYQVDLPTEGWWDGSPVRRRGRVH